MRKGNFPLLVDPVADEEGFTSASTEVTGFSDPNCVRPTDVARGLIWGPRICLAWDRVSIPSRYLTDWGCVSQTDLRNRREEPGAQPCTLSTTHFNFHLARIKFISFCYECLKLSSTVSIKHPNSPEKQRCKASTMSKQRHVRPEASEKKKNNE